ncbi:MAG: hypothetical protein ACM3O8_03800 [Methylococcaceae bacterium]
MKTIETPYTLIALRKMAKNSPRRLLRMEKEEPEKLLREIEMRVTNALGWIDTAIGKGGDKSKMEAMLDQLLLPDGASDPTDYPVISEQKIMEIHQKLISMAREK